VIFFFCRWTFNPVVLKKLSVGEAPPRLSLVMPEDPFMPEDPYMFQPGHFVKVNSDLEMVMKQQAGHGDWVPAMEMVRSRKKRTTILISLKSIHLFFLIHTI